MNIWLTETFLNFYITDTFLLYFQTLRMPFLAAVLMLIIIVAFISMPVVYFLTSESTRRLCAGIYGIIVIGSGGYGIIFLLFTLGWGGINYLVGGDLSLESFIRDMALSVGFIIAALLLGFTAHLIDPPPLLKRFRRKKKPNS